MREEVQIKEEDITESVIHTGIDGSTTIVQVQPEPEEVLGDILKRLRVLKPVQINRVLRAAATYFGVNAEEL